MNRAFIFPGQGSQSIGMGKDFYDSFLIAKEVFQEVDDTINYKLSNIIFNGSEEELTYTVNAQPAIMTVSIAILRVLQDVLGKNLNELCSYVAGHSLGEYSALCASESLSLKDTANLLQIRGISMQNAYPQGQGAMAACIGLEIKKIEELIKNTKNPAEVCQIANDNIKGQVVISGHLRVVNSIMDQIRNIGYKAVKLKVSAPFHCDLMRPAEEPMKMALNKIEIKRPIVPIIHNVTAIENYDTQEIKNYLLEQVTGRVRWRETLDRFQSLKITEIVEIGPGKILISMIKKANYPFAVRNISNVKELDEMIVNSLD